MAESSNSTSRSPSDEQLAVRAASGCLESFETLVARFQVPLLHFLQHRVGRREDAEDLIQEAFLRAYRNLDRYQTKWRFSTWLFTIAHRLAINAYRSDSRKQETAAAEGTLEKAESAVLGPEQQATRADEGRKLWAVAAAELGEPKFTAVWLYYAEAMTVSQIAEVLERTPGAIKTMLLRARRQLVPVLRGRWSEYAAAGSPSGNGAAHDKNRSALDTGVRR
ncbi:MAG: sigma-70 family RNA polymerase sigma factor [Planctomycetota bacterium]|nr:MAG: sigma-70 family RNA polymerase sigma factor [Planctomycetota bacterium]REJ93687.1 MAG: sigma-70 family RNA polymerase sigma factor [Planctomycetota bacterium]REK25736.1 MAG: sigma-70 family RNA polymerase sigma factor [Planctomycetota bacterium]REK46518.1 MAG: sigma-70 family RNA polymerase sigma factor [Planctomycetota bacterium]